MPPDSLRALEESGNLIVIPKTWKPLKSLPSRPHRKVLRNDHAKSALGSGLVVRRKTLCARPILITEVHNHGRYDTTILQCFVTNRQGAE